MDRAVPDLRFAPSGMTRGPGREHLLGRGGAEAVAGAEEEEVGQDNNIYLPITLFQSTAYPASWSS